MWETAFGPLFRRLGFEPATWIDQPPPEFARPPIFTVLGRDADRRPAVFFIWYLETPDTRALDYFAMVTRQPPITTRPPFQLAEAYYGLVVLAQNDRTWVDLVQARDLIPVTAYDIDLPRFLEILSSRHTPTGDR